MKIPMFLRWKDDTCFSCVFPIPLMRDFSNLKYRVTLMCVCKYLYFYLDIVPALYKQIKRVIFAILFTECPVSEDGMERFACPTADRMGRYHCIDDHVLCDGFIDCPTGEDEDRQACMFYKTVSKIL